MTTPSILCPCGSNNNYADCCTPIHHGKSVAATAETLMRSRFTAFFLAGQETPPRQSMLCEYLINSWHSCQYDDGETALRELQQGIQKQHWHSLKIIDRVAGLAGDTQGVVEFVAFFSVDDGPVQQLHERSNFLFEHGRWFYVDGSFQADIKLQRNDACWCGSGKKMKKCHA